ncbi:MAG: radical SAM family heme chaperone HemW [Bacteroidetes bacterium]|nr:MAG: radical SAM family heme chaperone HemW [Bacteroidota bacterium]
MAGIYIHIPFCRQACYYCDFHFSTSLKNKKELLTAIRKEISLQKEYLETKNINTIYFGGGTPSILSQDEILGIFEKISTHFSIGKDAEITMEANPDDLSKEKLAELAETPVNRLSIGVQSFREEDLKFLNRAHSSKEAVECVGNAKKAGFKNITIDLIYGIQTLTNDQWKRNIELALELDVPHISCYSLTVEPKTAFSSFIQKGKIRNVDSQKSAQHFERLMEEMSKNNFIHYEISNFCKEGFYSAHNSNYWRGEKYLGMGPSAHSYNGTSRQWNVKSNSAYIRSLEKNIIPFEKEDLTAAQRYNEYVLTSLRTIWGTDFDFIKKTFSENICSRFSKEVNRHLDNKMLSLDKKKIFLTDKGKLFADKIASDLFFTP